MADHEALGALPAAHWIHKALTKTKKGGLHKHLDVPSGKKIPAAKVEKAVDSKSPIVRKEAQMAENMNPGSY